jgi:uncharacterized protein (TIGR03089 family)
MADDTPESLFAARLAADPGRPLVTFYDDATGERAELSAKSLANWVAKTHFLLMDELGLGVGSSAYLRLPVHWLAAPVLFGCWFAGIEVVSDPRVAQVAFGDADSLASSDLGTVDEVFAVSLLSMARSAEPPAGMRDYAAAVRPQPDSWPTVRPQASATDPALNGQSRTELVVAAREAADRIGLASGGRLLWTSAWAGPQDWVAALLAPLAVGGSVVLVRNADAAQTERHAVSEGATARR